MPQENPNIEAIVLSDLLKEANGRVAEASAKLYAKDAELAKLKADLEKAKPDPAPVE